MKVKMTFERSTKNTHVYKDDTEGTPVKCLYIERKDMPTTPPASIELTVSFDELS